MRSAGQVVFGPFAGSESGDGPKVRITRHNRVAMMHGGYQRMRQIARVSQGSKLPGVDAPFDPGNEGQKHQRKGEDLLQSSFSVGSPGAKSGALSRAKR